MAYSRYAVCGCCLCIKNANCYILGEDVKWCGGCARRRGADFILSVKWLCAPRGPEAELVFSLSWFSRWWRGGCFLFWSSGLRSARARGRAGFFFKLVLEAGSRAGGAGDVFSFGQMALRSARARGRAGFFFKLVLAPVARGMFFFRLNGLRSARARGREGCFDSPLPTSGLHSPRNELRAARP